MRPEAVTPPPPKECCPANVAAFFWSVHGECGYLQCQFFASSSLVFCKFFARVACCVVGLWGCGVCVCLFYWPRGSQKASKICSVYQLLPKPNKNGTKIDHKWDQSGPGGGGKGQPKIDKNMKK